VREDTVRLWRSDFEAKVFRRREFGSELVLEGGIRPIALAKPTNGFQLDLFFAKFADISAHREPENELRIDLGARDQRRRFQRNEGSDPSSCIHAAQATSSRIKSHEAPRGPDRRRRDAQRGVPTIRYYEEIGLLPKPPRTKANRRNYNAADVRRLVFIRRARELGFEIEAIRALLTQQFSFWRGA
jgi:MerR HTH family regulatory protein